MKPESGLELWLRVRVLEQVQIFLLKFKNANVQKAQIIRFLSIKNLVHFNISEKKCIFKIRERGVWYKISKTFYFLILFYFTLFYFILFVKYQTHQEFLFYIAYSLQYLRKKCVFRIMWTGYRILIAKLHKITKILIKYNLIFIKKFATKNVFHSDHWNLWTEIMLIN